DFGIADVALGSRGGGTPAYMAPEQREGAAASPAADIYSLGLLLHEAIVGRLPLELADMEEEPPIPEALGPILDRLLATDPAQRPEAEDAANALEAFVAARRLEGAQTPRQGLRERATLAREGVGKKVEGTMPATLSFLRDGAEGSFQSRMTATAATDSEPAPAPPAPGAAASAPEPPRPRAPTQIALALAVALGGLMLSAWLGASLATSPERSEAQLLPTEPPGAERLEPPPGPATASEDEALSPGASQGAGTALALGEPARLEDPSAPPEPAAAAVEGEPGREAEAPGRGASSGKLPARPRPTRPSKVHATAPAPAPPPEGSLDLNAIPWARVFIDGREVGVTPLLDHGLEAGDHRLRLVNEPLGVDRRLRLSIRSGARERMVINLRDGD
ncbi:MAG: hypothetical protein OEY14_06385, partial [Myxococcales bacterium]|nr:hypothetical protein [Myxococcales bacterium]